MLSAYILCLSVAIFTGSCISVSSYVADVVVLVNCKIYFFIMNHKWKLNFYTELVIFIGVISN